ncbi:MAG: RlmE family RNA methyltransferase [Spirochaetales bacterium]
MGKRSRPDHFTDRAKRAGYSARSVYKLEELQKRFSLIRRGNNVLDVGAAPGSWSQFAAKIVGGEGAIVAVDLKEMPDLEAHANVRTFAGDIFEPTMVAELETLGPYDVVMSDAAPNTTGNRTVDTVRSAALVEQVVALAQSMLRDGGSLVAKIFQGGEEQNLLAIARNHFANARLIKPKASRSESFETFLVATGFAPEADQ